VKDKCKEKKLKLSKIKKTVFINISRTKEWG